MELLESIILLLELCYPCILITDPSNNDVICLAPTGFYLPTRHTNFADGSGMYFSLIIIIFYRQQKWILSLSRDINVCLISGCWYVEGGGIATNSWLSLCKIVWFIYSDQGSEIRKWERLYIGNYSVEYNHICMKDQRWSFHRIVPDKCDLFPESYQVRLC